MNQPTYFQAYHRGKPVEGIFCEFANARIARKDSDGSLSVYRGQRIDTVLPDGSRFQTARRRLLADTALVVLTTVAKAWELEAQAKAQSALDQASGALEGFVGLVR